MRLRLFVPSPLSVRPNHQGLIMKIIGLGTSALFSIALVGP